MNAAFVCQGWRNLIDGNECMIDDKSMLDVD